MKQNLIELKEFLDFKSNQYNHPNFIEQDPILIPHLFSQKEDIEIAGFLIATIAWGNRKSIIASGKKIMTLMNDNPYEFVMQHTPKDLKKFEGFAHRTFNAKDLCFFIAALKNIYQKHKGLESVFQQFATQHSLQDAIHEMKKIFFEIPHLQRNEKHISDPAKNSAAKRINMYLRWMIRKDNKGVDFGIWKSLNASQLSCPLDVHSGRVARKLGLLFRKQNDGIALIELDTQLRQFDSADPVKYDFALFGLGVFENF